MADDNALEKLNLTRDSYRLRVKGLLSRVSDLTAGSDSPQLSELQLLSEKIQRYSNSLDKLNEDIAQQLEGDDLKTDLSTCTQLQDEIWEAQARLATLMSSQVASDIAPDNATTISQAQVQNMQNRPQIKYPKLEMLKFSGDQLEWQEYWDSFKSSIHDSDMTNINKFQYLKSTLEGEAAKLVNGFCLTDANYDTVIEVLLGRYGNTELTIFAHFEQLLALSQASGETPSLQSTYDECERHIRSLGALGLEEETFGTVFSPIILSKLPKFIRVELHRKNGAQAWELNTLRELFKEELKARQMGEWSLGDKGKAQSGAKSGSPMGGEKQWKSWGSNPKNGRPLPSTSTLIQQSRAQNRDKQQTPGASKRNQQGSISCIYCKGSHYSDQCVKYTLYEDRRIIAMKGGHCFKCLSTKHPARTCPKNVKCFYCSQSTHHSSLCKGKSSQHSSGTQSHTLTSNMEQVPMNPSAPVFTPQSQQAQSSVVASHSQIHSDRVSQAQASSSSAAADGSSVYLQMALVKFDLGQFSINGRIFFDPSSSCSYVTTEYAKKLGRQPFGSTVVSNARFGDPNRSVRSYQTVSLPIPTKNGLTIPIKVFVTDLISPSLQKLPLDIQKYPVLQQLPLADYVSAQTEQVPIDIMIGQDHYYDFVGPEILRIADGLFLVGSKLGYLTAGKVSGITGVQPIPTFHAAGLLNFSTIGPRVINSDIDRFWSLEDIGIKEDVYQKDDDLAIQQFNQSIRKVDGRYEVGWPWREVSPDLANNFDLAFNRLRSLNRRLQSQPEQLKVYDGIIHNQLDLGIIEQVPPQEFKPEFGLVHHLPHHAVIKPSSVTTKVRVVHDASSKASKHALSLNDCLLRGPVFLTDLCGLHIRFRFNRIAFICDIEKAFFQVGLRPSDRDVTRFLWLKDPTKAISAENLVVYRFTKVLFGIVSSPFLLGATVKHHLLQSDSAFARVIVNNLYVDNIISGCDVVKDAKAFFDESRQLFSEIRMNLREWFTNSEDLRQYIPNELRGTNTTAQVLGMVWDTTADLLQFADPGIVTMAVKTKRHLVQAVSRIFDPCGYLAPAVCRAKILIQETWKRQLKWDEPLPQGIADTWSDIKQDFDGITQINVPRYLDLGPGGGDWQLHCLCDASSKAYAAVVYARNPSGSTHLLFSKSKLAPIKSVSLPRLELMAIVTGTRLVRFVKRELEAHNWEVTIWSDSKCALQCVASAKVLSTFVAIRVREIKQQDAEFRYIPTKLNPADAPSRDMSLTELKESKLWWSGPLFLEGSKDKWPKTEFSKGVEITEDPVAGSKTCTCAQISVIQSHGLFTIDLNRFKSLSRLLRVSFQVSRYILVLRHRVASRRKRSAELVALPNIRPVASDLDELKSRWIANVQDNSLKNQSYFVNLKEQLQVFEDSNGILRCGGRLKHADLTDDAKFPVLLPKSHSFTRLVINHCHEQVHHSGPGHTIAEVRASFWVPQLRSQVQSVIVARC